MMKRTTIFFVLILALISAGCNKPTSPAAPAAPQVSTITMEMQSGGPMVLTTSAAEFQILPSGSVQAFLLKNGAKLTLDAPSTDGSYLVQVFMKIVLYL
jgi:hypothetical protein